MYAHNNDFSSTSYQPKSFPLTAEDTRARAHSTTTSSYNGAGNNYGASPAVSNGADSYYATGLQSDVRNAVYPSIEEDQNDQARGYHQSSSSAYNRDPPSISSVMRGAASGDAYTVELGVASVSRLGRQVSVNVTYRLAKSHFCCRPSRARVVTL